ncbi:MAG: S8 family serine peptidase [Steroidobacteraceae bacterium]
MSRRCKTSGTLLAVFAFAVCISADAGTASVELQSVLDAAPPDQEIAVIVQYRGSYRPQRFRKPAIAAADINFTAFAAARKVRRQQILTQFQRAARAGAAPILDVVEQEGGRAVRLLWVADSIALRARRELIWTLLARPDVVEVRLDQALYAPIATAAVSGPVEWNINDIHAPDVWNRGYLGDGAVVALFDTGVDVNHPELSAAYRGGTNSWKDPYGQHATPRDSASGHGTQVLGIVLGGSLGGTAIGVAPGAKWIAAKVFNDAGMASESAIHLAFQWALDPDANPATDDAPDVVTNSWDIAGENTCNSAFQPDIDALRAADIAVVFSAGNYGPLPASSVSPANNLRVTSVGAVDSNNAITIFSSRGPSSCDGSVFPKVVAPGANILTTDLSLSGTAQYTHVEGTSFSAPHIAGVIALLRGAVPTASAAEVEAAIALTARDLGPPGPDPDYGYGLVDALAAYDLLSHPIDDDGDGYTSYPANNDCDDHDATVHPGAHDLRRDGVDQDCNGYDQTIDVKYAVYAHDGSKLNLRVTTFLHANAQLEIVGTGPMTWRAARRDWIFNGPTTGGPQKLITIRGVEGEITVKPRQPTRRP